MLILLITALSMMGQGQSKEEALQQYLETTKIAATEEFNKMQLPDYFIPIFKVSNRFQGSSIILKDQKTSMYLYLPLCLTFKFPDILSLFYYLDYLSKPLCLIVL